MGLWGVTIPQFTGVYGYELERAGTVVVAGEIQNSITEDGYIAGLNILFFGGTKTQNWYLGLMNVNTPGGTIVTTEFTGYSETNRPKWHSGVVSIGDHRLIDTYTDSLTCRVDCTTFAVYTITATAWVNQPFLTTAPGKTDNGTVWSRGAVPSFGSGAQVTARVMSGSTTTLRQGNIVVWPGDKLKLTYTLQAQQATGSCVLTGSKLWLDCMFKGVTAPSTWYVGLIKEGRSVGDPNEIRAIDTMASHNWTEFTDYQGDRKVFSPLSAAALYETADINNPDPPAFQEADSIDYRITANGTVGCYFIVADSYVKGGTSGTLFGQEGIEFQRRQTGPFVIPLSGIGDTNFGITGGMKYPIPVYKGERLRLRFLGTSNEGG